MPLAIVIGDGPAGLSAALFLAKNGKETLVFAQDQTPMHAAKLLNYLGIPAMPGSDFQKIARKQVTEQGGKIIDAPVESARRTDEGFSVSTPDGASHDARYLIIATGPKPKLAEDLGLALNKRQTVDADRNGRTSVANLYAVGWSVRPDKIQAIISAGDGAAAALDILSAEAGKDVHDFDEV